MWIIMITSIMFSSAGHTDLKTTFHTFESEAACRRAERNYNVGVREDEKYGVKFTLNMKAECLRDGGEPIQARAYPQPLPPPPVVRERLPPGYWGWPENRR